MAIWERLQLDMDRHRVVALVGGGGKSSTMYAMARQARDAGRTVIVTSTTHIMPHPGIFLTGDPEPASLREELARRGILTLGRFLAEGKLTGAGDAAVCKEVADITLVEADGARLHPLKAPAGHEPVIPACADAVLALAGMDSVGLPIGEACHRPELVCALLGRPTDWILTPADVADILSSPRGSRKGVGTRAFRCVLNKADTPVREEYAREISVILQQREILSAVTCYRTEERGGKCLF